MTGCSVVAALSNGRSVVLTLGVVLQCISQTREVSACCFCVLLIYECICQPQVVVTLKHEGCDSIVECRFVQEHV